MILTNVMMVGKYTSGGGGGDDEDVELQGEECRNERNTF